MAKSPKVAAATRTLQHVSDLYEELGRLLHMLREQVRTADGKALVGVFDRHTAACGEAV
jgi:hypothetical protein